MLGYAATVSGGLGLLLTVVLAVAVLVVAALSYLGYRQRHAVMAYAKMQGWSYRDHDPVLAARYSGPPFRGGTDAQAEAVITGAFKGMSFAAFAYTYQLEAAEPNGYTTTLTVTVPVVAVLLGSRLPDLAVVPAPQTDRLLADPSGHPVIGQLMLGDGPFDETFAVLSDDPAFASDVLTRRLTHDLMAYPDHAWAIREGDLLSIGTWNGKPEKIPAFLDHLGMVMHSITPDVWERYGGRVAERPTQTD